MPKLQPYTLLLLHQPPPPKYNVQYVVMITRQKKTNCNNHDATQKMITINYVLKEKKILYLYMKILFEKLN